MDKTIRWKQRYQNLIKAFEQFQKGVLISSPSDIEKQGVIKSFEYTFELSWKTLKDYLESQNVEVNFPRDVIKSAFQYQILSDGSVWMDMLDKRNLMAHTYDQEQADLVYETIARVYYQQIRELMQFFENKRTGEG